MPRPKKHSDDIPEHLRPGTSKRVNFALGEIAQDQSDILSRIFSTYNPTSRSAVVRGLLDHAMKAALKSGDPVVQEVVTRGAPFPSGYSPATEIADPKSVEIWTQVLHAVLGESYTDSTPD